MSFDSVIISLANLTNISIVTLEMLNNCEFILQNVSYVLEIKKNLLSINVFDDLGYCTKIER